jgi:phosphoglycolate phosphatase
VPPDALIFDLDGVLWDTNATCALGWNRVLARLGIAHREIVADDIRAVCGQPHPEAVRRVFPDLPRDQIQAIADHTQGEDVRLIAERGGELFPGVRELVPALRERLPLAIVSNCQSGYIEVFLETSGLGDYFVDFECWGNTGRSKGDNLRAVIERNRLRAPLFVGDTEGDREAARANGVRFVWARYGFGHATDFDHAIEHFGDLPALLDDCFGQRRLD